MSSINISTKNNPTPTNLKYQGKVVLVTGAGAGIGQAIAIYFASLGVNLVLAGRTEANLLTTSKIILTEHKYPVKVVHHAGDLGLDSVNKAVVDLAIKTFGRLDIAINNAGTFIFESIVGSTEATVDNLLNTNIKSVIYGTKYQLPAISKSATKSDQGSIIYIGSAVSAKPAPNGSVYAGTKAFIDSFVLSAAKEGSGYNVRVNTVSPGGVLTDRISNMMTKEILEKFREADTFSDSLATPEEIAIFVEHAVSTRYLNGSTLVIDGGRQAK